MLGRKSSAISRDVMSHSLRRVLTRLWKSLVCVRLPNTVLKLIVLQMRLKRKQHPVPQLSKLICCSPNSKSSFSRLLSLGISQNNQLICLSASNTCRTLEMDSQETILQSKGIKPDCPVLPYANDASFKSRAGFPEEIYKTMDFFLVDIRPSSAAVYTQREAYGQSDQHCPIARCNRPNSSVLGIEWSSLCRRAIQYQPRASTEVISTVCCLIGRDRYALILEHPRLKLLCPRGIIQLV